MYAGNQFIAVGNAATIFTSPDDLAVAITPHLQNHNGIFLRLTPFTLFATLPPSLRGSDMRAAVYTMVGKKVVEVRATGSGEGISIPIGGMARGMYLFEAKTPGARVTRTFSIAR